MTLQTIEAKLKARADALKASQHRETIFILCGIRCRIQMGLDDGLFYAYKFPIMPGYYNVTADALAEYIYRFQL